MALARLHDMGRLQALITQNVDGLHRFAGSMNLVEVHGHMFDLYCTQCGCDYTATELLSDFRDQPKLPPKCSKCHGIVRPRVVLFDESLPHGVVRCMKELSNRDFDIVLAIGTSAVFHYIKQPLSLAQSKNIPTVEINPTQTAVSSGCRYRIRLGAADAMQRIRKCMN